MTNNNIFKMWFLFFVIIIFAMPRHICFADNNRVVSGDYIWVMDGSSSIYLAVKVKVDIEDTKLLLFVDKVKEPVIILNVINNEVKGRITGDDGDYSISGKIKSNSEIKGEFNFKVSEKGVKNEFMNDDGTFLLIPYTQQKLIKYQECVNERLYRIDMHESLEEMAKRSPWARKHLKQREKDRGSQENPIVFYGKAIDQFGHPVADAEIKYSIKIYTLIVWSKDNVKDYDTKSDDNGLFTIKEHKGRSLDIRTITKNGFRGLFANKDFDYEHGRFIADKEHPVVFAMSKITDKATFLLNNEHFDIALNGSKDDKSFAFIDIRQDWSDANPEKDYTRDYLQNNYDVKVSAVFDKVKSDWTVTFSSSGKEGGVLLKDECLTEAPVDGYEKGFKFIQHVITDKERESYENADSNGDDRARDKYQDLEKFKLQDKYLYIRSREPAIYTRMELTGMSADNEQIRIEANVATNPYGERNLEFNDELPLELMQSLGGKVLDAFFKGKRPERPDINKMFDEFKKTHKPVKNTYGSTVWVEVKE